MPKEKVLLPRISAETVQAACVKVTDAEIQQMTDDFDREQPEMLTYISRTGIPLLAQAAMVGAMSAFYAALKAQIAKGEDAGKRPPQSV